VKNLDLSSKSRPSPHWMTFAAASLLAVALAGCGGGDGAAGAAGAVGAIGATGATGTPGKNAVVKVDVTAMTTEQWANAQLAGQITNVDMSKGTPVVNFKVNDASGNAIVGLANFTMKSANDTYAKYPVTQFLLAKLIPASNGAPSRWVNYQVTTVPSVSAPTVTASTPSTDNQGTLVDNGDGSYQYTFYRDITKAKSIVAGLTLTAPKVAADLDDLTYDPSLTHRMAIIIGGAARGTGTAATHDQNTPNGADGTPTVAMKKGLNLFYDFIPATGKTVTATDAQREVVSVTACFECHSRFEFHAGARQDTKLCVTCHTDQRKFGTVEATTTATGYSGTTSRINGFAVGNIPNFIHKLHRGAELGKTGYNYGGILFNEVTYPQTITNCVKCHDGSATAANKTAQGDNWKNVPSRMACGACHDGINFATGGGTNMAGTYAGHIGGAKADDSLCAVCHDAATIPTYHVTVDPKGSVDRGGYPLNTAVNVPTVGLAAGMGPAIPLASQLNLPAGVYKINFEIKQVTVTGAAGAKKANVVYRIMKDNQFVTLNSTGFLINNVDGTPSIYVAYAVPQDGIAAPADWNKSINATVLALRDGALQTGPDASGYYTATLPTVIPDNAKMVTAAMGINYNGFVQLGLTAYPKGIRLREPAFAMKLADGYTARRTIVSNAKCNACHGQLGVEPSFHSGARNNGEGCAICHDANNATGHTGAANNFGGGWNVGIKNLVHSVHASAKRAQAFSYEATAANPGGFQEVTYPGVLNNCEQCHVAGSYDFSATANSAALPNLLWTTDAKADMSNPTNAPSIGLSPWINLLGKGQINYTADNLVTSPLTSACFGCHDSSTAVAHMQLNGGTIYGLVSTVSTTGVARPAIGTTTTFGFTKVEACAVCHAPGKVADVKAVHN
jgi:OmcA/MtrC family decaheme c-type cytochrome